LPWTGAFVDVDYRHGVSTQSNWGYALMKQVPANPYFSTFATTTRYETCIFSMLNLIGHGAWHGVFVLAPGSVPLLLRPLPSRDQRAYDSDHRRIVQAPTITARGDAPEPPPCPHPPIDP